MTRPAHQEQATTCGLLRAVSRTLGYEVAPEWRQAAAAAPRHAFLPDRVWLADGDAYELCDRRSEPERWLAAAYADAPVVTQINDGQEPEDAADRWPSCSASAPSIVVTMLDALELAPGTRVLEIGTGTGWTAALLAHRLGDANVTTIEVDPYLAARARATLGAAGYAPTVVCGDGRSGGPPGESYDRVVATCSLRRVPPAWIAQTRTGGMILAPWDNPWVCGGLLTLTVLAEGSAVGRFTPDSAFMLMRTQRQDVRLFRDVVHEDHQPVPSVTTLDPWAVADSCFETRFALGHRLGDLWHVWDHDPGVDGVVTRLWVAGTDGRSWAAVDWDGTEDTDRYAVWQHGPRRLWEEVEAAHRWWLDADRPAPTRLGLTVTSDGRHRAWLDTPENSWPLP
ncbi:methyltransferase domain-containing protein [Kitasatospora sp. NPDC096140]|uniref:methyltransferase domain-containing protein n=1 Tax=Kitasatospora sp. NPDC096140 TaxID=3155425 RepID=UPI0033298727